MCQHVRPAGALTLNNEMFASISSHLILQSSKHVKKSSDLVSLTCPVEAADFEKINENPFVVEEERVYTFFGLEISMNL